MLTQEEIGILAEIVGTANQDTTWKNLGFRGRPRGGTLIRWLFCPAWKNQLVNLACRQIIAVFSAVCVLGGRLPRSAVAEAATLYIDGAPGLPPLYRVLGYKTSDGAIPHLHSVIMQYVDSPPREWFEILVQKLGIIDLPDKDLATNLMAGAVRFCHDAENLVAVLESDSAEVERVSVSSRNDIQRLAHLVGNGLTVYIDVHNKIFRESATFKSVVKNLFCRGVPMSRLLEASEQLVPLWRAICDELQEFRWNSYSSLTLDEQSYFDILWRYAVAVRKTVGALVERQRLLDQGSQGGRGNPMTWESLQEKERLYESAIAAYMAIGQELNDAAELVFD